MELNELQGSCWQETGRWVGYEENLNPATGKWGPSHVSYLTFKSLIQLRKIMSTGAFTTYNEAGIQSMFDEFVQLKATQMYSGAVILDLNASSLSAVAEKVADELLNKGEIRASDRDGLLRALLLRRR